MSDPFDRWGLSETASEQDIKRVYKKRVQKMHPDRAGNTPEVLAAFLLLQEDYAILKDYDQRQALVLFRQQARRGAGCDVYNHRPDPIVETVDISTDVPASDLKAHVSVPLAVICTGGKIETQISVGEPCGCNRSPTCVFCRGSGQVFTEKRVRVKIPAGTLSGQFLTIPNEGHKGTHGRGDLLIVVKWSHTHGWKWNGQTLEKTVVLPWWNFGAGKSFVLQAPSGAWGQVQLPSTVGNKKRIAIQVPNLGLPGANHQNSSVVVTVTRAPWYAPWTGLTHQLRKKHA